MNTHSLSNTDIRSHPAVAVGEGGDAGNIDLTFGLGQLDSSATPLAAEARATAASAASPYPLLWRGASVGVSNGMHSVLERLRYWQQELLLLQRGRKLFAPAGIGLRIPGKLMAFRARSREQIPDDLRVGLMEGLNGTVETWIVLRARSDGGIFSSLIYGLPLRYFISDLQQRATTPPRWEAVRDRYTSVTRTYHRWIIDDMLTLPENFASAGCEPSSIFGIAN